jgi:hypothetical protein
VLLLGGAASAALLLLKSCGREVEDESGTLTAKLKVSALGTRTSGKKFLQPGIEQS